MEEQDQIVARRKKLAELEALGHRRFPNGFQPRDMAAALLAAHADTSGDDLDARPVPVRIAGRIVGVRDFGKAAFAHVQDRSGRIQVYVRRDEVGDRDFEVFRLLDLGDFVGIEGRLFRTKTGELSVLAARVHYLAKALRPPPEKWHGLQDVELRYRQRYLDLLNPDVQRIFRVRAQVLQGVREFFAQRGYLEVETPMMQQIAGGALARPFVTHHNTLDMDLYLRVAPELFLKRLLVGGLERVFELNRNFRNEGISTEHNPEFTMLEFYEAYATWEDLLTITEELISELARTIVGAVKIPYGAHEIDLTPPWRRVAVKDAVAQATGLASAEVDDVERLRAVAAARAIPLPPGAPYGKVLAEIFEKTAEAALVQPTFVVDYPVEISPLARQSDRDPTLVDRFELYVAGREIANGFSELNDPDEQRARFEEQLRARRGGDEEAHAMDEDYVRALEHGMPPAAGEGIGIDRLVMLLTNSPSIRDVILFPQLRPERR
ncbi:MAG: lysine--tRNA ligase [Deltaproteobacteria bacterium]|nr:MAG: lysine--tRNA ligase [Deltaproteobacteria bacterium]